MIRAQLKGLYTLEMAKLDGFKPSDPECFQLYIRAMIGPEGQDGEESFDIKVCSPKWLEQECARSGYVFGRHHLVLNSFDPNQIEAAVRKFVSTTCGNTWADVGAKLARMGHWEFEDYSE
jgi:Immunity protein 8